MPDIKRKHKRHKKEEKMLLMFVEEARGEQLCQNWGDKSEKNKDLVFVPICPISKKVHLYSADEQRY